MRFNKIKSVAVFSLTISSSALAAAPAPVLNQPGQSSNAPQASAQAATQPGQVSAPQAPAAQGSVINYGSSSTVLTLSDATKGGQEAPTAKPAAGETTVPPIQESKATADSKTVDEAGKNLERTLATIRRKRAAVELIRVNSIDGVYTSAMLSVRGMDRRVQVGSKVLEKVVTEIRDDGVCLAGPDDKKKKCAQFVTLPFGDE